MKMQKIQDSKLWDEYIGIIDVHSDPLDFLLAYENIPYKKSNRIKSTCKRNNCSIPIQSI